jgi:hypothetical protein
MILTAHAIQSAKNLGEVTIQSFTVENLGTISYRFALGAHIIVVDKTQDSKEFLEGQAACNPQHRSSIAPACPLFGFYL